LQILGKNESARFNINIMFKEFKEFALKGNLACCLIEADTEKNSGLGKGSPVAS
jgi:hypothetical protein